MSKPKAPKNVKSIIIKMLGQSKSLDMIGKACGISRQRIYQLMIIHNIETPVQRQRGYWRNQPLKNQWLWKIITHKLSKTSIKNKFLARQLFDSLKDSIPDVCPILQLPLDYGLSITGFNNDNSPSLDRTDNDNSPSLDRTDNNKGYELGNVCIISVRANRIKSNGTAEEHNKIATYMRVLGAT